MAIKSYTPSEIAEKHGINIDEALRLILEGAKVEKEHTDSEVTARDIASAHVWENIGYYPALKRMEKELDEKDKIDNIQSIMEPAKLKEFPVVIDIPNPFPESKIQQVLYHGTKSDPFLYFDSSKKGSNTGDDNTDWGFFFTDQKGLTELKREHPSTFGETILPVYVNLRNPIDITMDSIFSNEEYAPVIAEYISGGKKLTPKAALKMINKEIGLGELGEFYYELRTQEFADFVKERGYDGIIASLGNDNLEYVTFSADQVQILTPEALQYAKNKNIESGLNKILIRTVTIRGDQINIYSVDANYVRANYHPDWNSGGHILGWSEGMLFIPKGEIWIDQSSDEVAREGFILHEVNEYENMVYNGMDYETAHEIANKKEQEYLKEQQPATENTGKMEDKSTFPIEGTYYILNSDNKLELHIPGKGDYMKLPEEVKKDIKSGFIWGRQRGAWVSRSKGGHVPYSMKKYNIEYRGAAELKSFEESEEQRIARLEGKAERFEKYAENAEKRAESLQSEFNRLRKDWSWLTQPNVNTSGGRSFSRSRDRVMGRYDKGIEEYQKAGRMAEYAEELGIRATQAELKDLGYLQNRLAENKKIISGFPKFEKYYEQAIAKRDDLKTETQIWLDGQMNRYTQAFDKYEYYLSYYNELVEERKAAGTYFDEEEVRKTIKKDFKEFLKKYYDIELTYIGVAFKSKDGVTYFFRTDKEVPEAFSSRMGNPNAAQQSTKYLYFMMEKVRKQKEAEIAAMEAEQEIEAPIAEEISEQIENTPPVQEVVQVTEVIIPDKCLEFAEQFEKRHNKKVVRVGDQITLDGVVSEVRSIEKNNIIFSQKLYKQAPESTIPMDFEELAELFSKGRITFDGYSNSDTDMVLFSEMIMALKYCQIMDEKTEQVIETEQKLQNAKQLIIEFQNEQSTPALKLSDIPESVKVFMPEFQQRAIVGSREHWEVITRLQSIINSMPKTYDTENIPAEQKLVYLHYFSGSSDWYIVEKDIMEKQKQAFGYTILNGDLQNAEWGYVSIEELKATGRVELDFYWDVKPFISIMKQEAEEEIAEASSNQKQAWEMTYDEWMGSVRVEQEDVPGAPYASKQFLLLPGRHKGEYERFMYNVNTPKEAQELRFSKAYVLLIKMHIDEGDNITDNVMNSYLERLSYISANENAEPAADDQAQLELENENDIALLELEMEMMGEPATPEKDNKIKKGSILVAKWGHEQTNVDFYLVTKRTGQNAFLVPISNVVVEDNAERMTRIVKPADEPIAGEKEMRRKVKESKDGSGEEYIQLASYKYAELWDGKPKTESYYG